MVAAPASLSLVPPPPITAVGSGPSSRQQPPPAPVAEDPKSLALIAWLI